MQAATVELLCRKGAFPTQQALAVAEAIDMAIADAQPVTVPILDARFLASEAKVDARFTAFEAKTDARFAAFEAKMNARFNTFEAKADARFQVFEAEFRALRTEIDQRFDRLHLKLVMGVIAVIVGNAALGPLGSATLEAIRRAF
jgi:hypothetical protein